MRRKLGRATSLACVGALMLVPASPAHAYRERTEIDVGIYTRITEGFTSLFEMASRPGNFQNRRNVLRFVRELYGPLADMQVNKLVIEKQLSRAQCALDRTAPPEARTAASALIGNRAALRLAIQRLGRAVRPHGMETSMSELSADMAHLYAEKSWVPDVARFCGLAASVRTRLMGDIRTSRIELGKVIESHNRLVKKLGG